MKYYAESKIKDRDSDREVVVSINVTGFDSDDKLKELITENGDLIFQSILKYLGWVK